MASEYILYLSIIGLGIISSSMLLFLLRKQASEFPEEWKKSLLNKNFRISILFLMLYLLIDFIGEMIAILLAKHGIYNHFVICINESLFTPFLLGFLFIHTPTFWKRSIYIVLYTILVSYYSIGGYFLPGSVLPNNSVFLSFSICFLAALIHLSDLLINPKSEHFKFQLKISVVLLVSNILMIMLTSFYWYNRELNLFDDDLVYYVHFYNTIIYYLALDTIFITEVLKLRRG